MYFIKSTHNAQVIIPDVVTVGGCQDDSDQEVIAFAAQHSHSGRLSCYFNARVVRDHAGMADVRFDKD